MNSMYSLMLDSGVVKAVDRLAYGRGMSRSALINQILAEYVSYLTPQMRISRIFQSVADAAADHATLQFPAQPSGSLLTIKSVLNYKYNPTVRYHVELQAVSRGYAGEFRILSRSRSRPLLERLSLFFQLWAQMETALLASAGRTDLPGYEMEEGRFRRTLSVDSPGEPPDPQQLGEAIANYVSLFDGAADLFLDMGEGKEQAAFQRISGSYLEYWKQNKITF